MQIAQTLPGNTFLPSLVHRYKSDKFLTRLNIHHYHHHHRDLSVLDQRLLALKQALRATAAWLVFVNALLEHKLLVLLVVNLEQLDAPDIDNKKEEAAGIYNTLQILKNLADLERARRCA